MPVTRSSAASRPNAGRGLQRQPVWRVRELLWMLAAGLVVAAALWFVWRARTAGFADAEQALAAKQIVNLNALSEREDLLPVLTLYPDPAEREFVARKIYSISGGLANVGTIARIRVARDEVAGRGSQAFRDRLNGRESVPLVSGEQLRLLKPSLVVRRPEDFRRSFRIWIALFFAAFLLVHVVWSVRGFRGDQTLAAGARAALRHRPGVDDQPARSAARSVAVRRFRPGRGARLPADGRRRAAGFRAPHRPLELRAAIGQLRAFRVADRLRLRSGRERCQGQPARFSAGGNHPRAAGVFSGRLFCSGVGRAAARARNPRFARRAHPSYRYSAARIHPAGRRVRGAFAAVFLPAKGYGPGAGLLLPVSDALWHRARERCSCRWSAWRWWCWASWPASTWACRTPSASAFPCGFRPGTT